MKVLVAAACVALIAFVGYFFWSEWRKAEDTRLNQEFVVARSACVINLEEYRRILTVSRPEDSTRSPARAKVEDCMSRGLLAPEEIK